MAHLTLEQRYKIESYKNAGKSITEISEYIGKHRSVVSRELKRNSDLRGGAYKAGLAERKCRERHRDKHKNRRFNANVEANVLYYLGMDHSPEQAVGRAKTDGREMVSVESIYQYVWEDKRKGGQLYRHLRTKGKKYNKRGGKKGSRGLLVDRVDIEKRPPIVDDKERLGDMEIDLVVGQNHKGALLTINDRATGYLFMAKIDSKEAGAVESNTVALLQDWRGLLKTMTSDNGKEFANHKRIARRLDIDYYFAKPYHSWERGANENLNGLVRQYFPKKTSFANVTKTDVEHVTNILNNRPRKRFGYKTPSEVFAQKLNDLEHVAFIT